MTALIASRLAGIHAATIVPLNDDFSIDEAALAAHVTQVTATPGIRGLLLNGHAGENFVLSAVEKRRVIEIGRASVPPGCIICSGVNAESSLELARESEAAEAAGADLLLVFPPNSFALGHDPEAALIHHRHALAASSLPILLYGAPVGAGHMAYDSRTLAALADEPRIVGVKEGSWEISAYEENLRLLKSLRPDFVVLGSGDEHLLHSYLIGSAGSQVSLAAIVPELIVALWETCARGDWAAARRLHDLIYPLSVAIYRDAPGGRATARLKACLALMGRIEQDRAADDQAAAAARVRTGTRSVARGARAGGRACLG
jgi:4-hydroxy-tetrahydrodipicolinate synthase